MLKKTLSAMICMVLIFCSFAVISHAASSNGNAPGGNVSNYNELISALGGADGLILEDDRLLIVKDVILENPVVITEGSYTIVGEGATISAIFDSGDLFVLRGEQTLLCLGDRNAVEENQDLVFDGESERVTREGSLIRTEDGATLQLYRSVRLKNAITSVSGGAIYNEGKLVMYGGEILNCKAVASGGAVYNSGDAVFASGAIWDCSANHGGLVYNEGKASFAGTEFSGGFALNGGAIFNASEMQFLSSVISECNANKGGAIYSSGTLTVSGGSITACGGDTCIGGGIFNAGTLEILGSALRENSAENGGNVYNTGTMNFGDSLYISEGNALKCGGNIYNDSNAVINFSRGTVTFGKAKYGGGIYNLGRLNLTGGGLSSNSAEIGDAILNHGILNLSGYGYCGKNNGIFVVLTDDDKHAVNVSADWSFARQIIQLSCGAYENGVYSHKHSVGDKLLNLEGELDVSKRFALFKTDLGLIISDDGTLKRAPVVSSGVIVAVIIAVISFAAVVSAIVFTIRYFDKKKLAADALSS